MKNRVIIFCSFLLIGLIAGMAFAAAPATRTVNPGAMNTYNDVVVQSGPMSPNKNGNVCVTKTIHNAGNIQTFNLYTSNRWYQRAEWQAVKASDGTAFIVQRKLGNNSAGTPGSSGSLTVNRQYTTYTISTFGNNTSAELNICQDRQ